MENAAKALIIAGAVLLAILLLSLFVYISKDMAKSASNIYANLEESEISEYNQQFLNYDKRQDLNIQDVVTIINLAKNQNEIQKLYEDVECVWPEDDQWHLYSKFQIENYLQKQNICPESYTLNAGSGGNNYGLAIKMHHRDLAENKVRCFDDYTVGSIESLPHPNQSFDNIICVGSVINYCDVLAVISEFSRVIKSQGMLYLEFESSFGYEHRKHNYYKKPAEVVKLKYFGDFWNQWIYSPTYIKEILKQYGFKIVGDFYFHILSAYIYSNCQDENKAAQYSKYDKILRHTIWKKHANNVLFKCKKL